MRKFGAPVLAAALLVLAGCATGYGHSGLLGGYSDEQVEPGLWRVRARTNGFSGATSAFNMALYRAAELARDAGYPYFQIVQSNFGVLPLVAGNFIYSSGGGQTARFRIRGARSADAPIACEMVDSRGCHTFPVEEVLRQIGPELNRR
jgi:hypothetical protein